MKKLLLSSLITASLFGLSACGDKQEAKATTADNSKPVIQAPEQKVAEAKEVVDSATAAENAFKAITEASQTYYQNTLSAHPIIKSVTYIQDSYIKGTDTSTATTKGTVTLTMDIEGKKSFDLMFKHTIKHDAATLGKGLVASIDSVIEKPADSSKEIAQLIENFSYVTDIKADGGLSQNMTLKPVTFDDDGEKVQINGAEISTTSTMKDIAEGFGSSTFHFKGMTATDKDDTFTVDPFTMTGDYKPSGEFNFKSTTPLVISDSETKVQVADIIASGNILMNKKFNAMLGKQNYQVNNIQITSPDLPTPITIDAVTVDADTQINDKDILSQSVNINLVPAAGLTSSLSQGMLDLSVANISFQLNDVPASILSEYQNMMNDIYSNIDGETEEADKAEADMDARLKTMFQAVKAQGSSLKLGVNLTAAEGPANIDAEVKILSDSPMTFEELETLASPAQILNLININANAKVPAALLEKTGAQMMVGPFIKKNGDVYESTVTTENGQLLINGIPAPL